MRGKKIKGNSNAGQQRIGNIGRKGVAVAIAIACCIVIFDGSSDVLMQEIKDQRDRVVD